ncbi:hypothetical protein LguiA_022540 [Lonicera macranthoides]
MVVALGPGKFYGGSLPRPRYYTDVKFNDERVDPPVPVLDSFLSWANEAHWSMGGLNVKRHRLQGRIEGSVKKLRAEHEKSFKRTRKLDSIQTRHKSEKGLAPPGTVRSASPSPSPPPAPVAVKRRRVLGLIDDDEEDEERENRSEEREIGRRRRPARKLWDEFDKVAVESRVKSPGSVSEVEGVALRTRGRRSGKEEDLSEERVEVVNTKGKKGKTLKKSFGKAAKGNGDSTPVSVTRSSPRLVKRRLN